LSLPLAWISGDVTEHAGKQARPGGLASHTPREESVARGKARITPLAPTGC
jgi:hypothetical protein